MDCISIVLPVSWLHDIEIANGYFYAVQSSLQFKVYRLFPCKTLDLGPIQDLIDQSNNQVIPFGNPVGAQKDFRAITDMSNWIKNHPIETVTAIGL